MSSQTNSQLKILILTHNYIRFPGDHAGLFVHIIAKGLVQSGHKVFVLVPHQKGLKTFEIMDDVAVYRFRYAPSGMERLAYIGTMHELVARSWINKFLFLSFLTSFLLSSISLSIRKGIDLISAQWWIPGGLIGYVISFLSRKPLIVTSHGTDIRILEKPGLTSQLAGLVYCRAKYITTVSTFLKAKLVKSLELDPEKVKVIPMPVTPEVFTPTPLKSEGVKVILCVARFTPQKGLDFFLKACGILKEKGIDFQAKIVGEGPLKNSLKEEIVNLKLEDQVSLVDIMSQDKLNLLYAESYVCVLPSVEEGFGLVLVEAQLCKRPVIGTHSGGIPDIIEDDISGILVPPQDELSLASAMEKILMDHNLASRLAETGYQSAIAKFSPEAVLKKYMEVFMQSY